MGIENSNLCAALKPLLATKAHIPECPLSQQQSPGVHSSEERQDCDNLSLSRCKQGPNDMVSNDALWSFDLSNREEAGIRCLFEC